MSTQTPFSPGKRILIVVMAIIVAIGVGAGFYLVFQKQFEGYTGPVEKITVASPLQEASVLFYPSKEKGYFLDSGMDVEIISVQSGLDAVKKVLSKEADIALSTDHVLAVLGPDNKNLRIITSVAGAEVEELIARKDSRILNPKDSYNY